MLLFTAAYSIRTSYLDQSYQRLESVALVLRKQINKELQHSKNLPGNAELTELACETDVHVALISSQGKIISDSDSGGVELSDNTFFPDVRAAFANGKGYYAGQDLKTLESRIYLSLLISSEFPEDKKVLRVSAPLSSAYSLSSALYTRIFLAVLLLIAIATLLSKWLAKKIAYPLEQIKQGAERFARGDLGFRLYAPRNDEHGRLARVLNKMAAQLDERIRVIMVQRNELDAVLASMREGVIAIDLDERILRINEAACKMLGADIKKANGKSIEEVLRNISLQKFVKHALTQNISVEAELVLHEEGEINVKAYSQALNNSEGQRIGVLLVLNDVTRLLQLENIRRDFVANVSHELKTPITSIKGFVETLLEGAMNEPAEAQRFLKIIARQADRLNSIFDDLLLIARLEQDNTPEKIERENIRIVDLITAAIQSCAHKAQEKSVVIESECSNELTGSLSPSMVEQALVNLIDNAVKHSPNGSKVKVSALIEDQYIRFEVEDSGIGIESQHLDRIFERFYRVDQARSRQQGGTGLGLSIVKHIALLHKGYAKVESHLGKGSKFYLYILKDIK